MPSMADQDELASLSDVTLALVVDLGHQRTGRVQYRQLPLDGLVLDALGDPMGAENRYRVRGDLGQVLDEPGALGLEALNNVLVVHDLVAHIDRRPIFLQGALDDLDGTNHAGAESPGLGQNHFHAKILSRRSRRTSLVPTPYIDQAPIGEVLPKSCTTSRRTSRPSASNTLATMPLASSPALAYIAAGQCWSMNTSGNTMQRTLRPLSKTPCSASVCRTCEPKPPIEPSSTVTSTSCSRASRRMRSTSSGLAKRASATVVVSPCAASVSAASMHSARRVPNDNSATELPSRMIRPLPISSWMPNSGMSTPTPSPRG